MIINTIHQYCPDKKMAIHAYNNLCKEKDGWSLRISQYHFEISDVENVIHIAKLRYILDLSKYIRKCTYSLESTVIAYKIQLQPI